MNISIKAGKGKPITDSTLTEALKKSLEGRVLSKVLLLPPDLTRLHSYAGKITALYYDLLKDKCQVDIMPALGTHDAMTKEECLEFFGPDVPYESIIPHKWRTDIVKIGQIPSDYVKEVSGGLIDYSIDVEVNNRRGQRYEFIISTGCRAHEVRHGKLYKNVLLPGAANQKQAPFSAQFMVWKE